MVRLMASYLSSNCQTNGLVVPHITTTNLPSLPLYFAIDQSPVILLFNAVSRPEIAMHG